MSDPAEKQVRVGVGVFVQTRNGYILLKRQGSHGAGEWSLPGGHLDFGETVAQCAAREVMEELGVTITDIVAVPYFSEDSFPDVGKQYITLYVIAYTDEVPQIMEPHKASELAYAYTELPQPMFCGTDAAFEVIMKSQEGFRKL